MATVATAEDIQNLEARITARLDRTSPDRSAAKEKVTKFLRKAGIYTKNDTLTKSYRSR
jgi:hypothetical protein